MSSTPVPLLYMIIIGRQFVFFIFAVTSFLFKALIMELRCCLPVSLRDKLLIHAMILALAINNYSLNLSILSKVTYMPGGTHRENRHVHVTGSIFTMILFVYCCCDRTSSYLKQSLVSWRKRSVAKSRRSRGSLPVGRRRPDR